MLGFIRMVAMMALVASAVAQDYTMAEREAAGDVEAEEVGPNGEHWPVKFSQDDLEKPWNYTYAQHVEPSKIDWDKAIAESQKILSKIHARYEFDGKGVKSSGRLFMLSVSNMRAKVWDMIKYKTALKMLDPDYKIYKMIFGGSSVTAGHDNVYKQAYPNIVYESLGPMLASVGIDMQVHNIAQTANGCIPYDLCYEAMGGMDADLVNWEQSYNCGHDDGAFELTARWAGWSKHRGIVQFSASGAWAPSNCNKSSDHPPFSDHEWTPKSAGIEDWKPKTTDLAEWKKTMDQFAQAHDSHARFTGSWGNDKAYAGVGKMAFNVWEGNSKAIYDGKGGQMGFSIASPCGNMRFMTKEASVYGLGKGARWHPTRGFHLLRGEFIAWNHALPMLDAIYMVKEDFASGAKESTLLETYRAKVHELMPPMGSPKRCQKYHCEERPNCFTNYYPHFPTDHTITELIVGQNAWSYKGSIPTKGWHGAHGYRDLKPYFEVDSAKPEAGGFHVKVQTNKKDFFWVCGVKLENVKFFLHENGQDTLPKKEGSHQPYTPPHDSERKLLVNSEPKDGGGCRHLAGIPKGKHILSLEYDYSSKDKAQVHNVIMW